MVKCQQEGKIVICGYIADQSPMWNSIHHWVDFLRHDTPVFTGSEKLACHFNQAVFYGDMSRMSRGHYNCEFRLLTRSPKEQPEFHVTDVYFRLPPITYGAITDGNVPTRSSTPISNT